MRVYYHPLTVCCIGYGFPVCVFMGCPTMSIFQTCPTSPERIWIYDQVRLMLMEGSAILKLVQDLVTWWSWPLKHSMGLDFLACAWICSYELIVTLMFIIMQTPSYSHWGHFTSHFLFLEIDDFIFQDIKVTDDKAAYRDEDGVTQLVQVQKKENIIEKSFDKLKEASTVWISYHFPAVKIAIVQISCIADLAFSYLTGHIFHSWWVNSFQGIRFFDYLFM